MFYINIYKLFSILFSMTFFLGHGSISKNSTTASTARVGNYSLLCDVHLEEGVKVWHFCNLYGCRIGTNSHVGSYTQIGKESVVGKYCRIHDGVSIPSRIVIRDYVFIGAKVAFANDRFPTVQKTLDRAYDLQPVRVNDYAAIGMGAIISAGVTIGRNSLVGAGSIVIHDVPEHAIVVGNPARVIGDVRDKKYESHKINNECFLTEQ